MQYCIIETESQPQPGRKLEHTFDVRSFPWFRSSRIDNTTTSMSLRLSLLSLIEYVDTDTIPGVSSNDTFVQRLDFSNSSTIMSLNSTLNSTFGLNNTSFFQNLASSWSVNDDQNYWVLTAQSASQPNMPNIDILAAIADLRGWNTDLNATLAPDAWKWSISITGWKYLQSNSKLAMKFVIDSVEEAFLSGILPSNQSDDPSVSEQVTAIVFNCTANPAIGYSASDSGYAGWNVEALYQKDATSRPIVGNIIVSEPVLLSQDFKAFQESAATLSMLNSPDLGRDAVREPIQTVVYVSFEFAQPYYIVYDPWIGIDETDFPVKSDIPDLAPRWWVAILFAMFAIAFAF